MNVNCDKARNDAERRFRLPDPTFDPRREWRWWLVTGALCLVGLALGYVESGCTPPAPPALHPDAAGDAALPCDGDGPAIACCNLARLGCQVGADPNCADALRSSPDVISQSIIEALATARTKEEARAVGSYAGHPRGLVECP